MQNRFERITVEELAIDCIDGREFHRIGLLNRHCAPHWPEFRWPGIERIRFDRYLINIKLCNQVAPQQIQVTWTPCHFGGS